MGFLTGRYNSSALLYASPFFGNIFHFPRFLTIARCLLATGPCYIQVYASKWVCDMNTFYSMGDSTVFLSLQVVCRNAEALGGAVAGVISIWLFTLDPVAPFLFAAALSGRWDV